MDTEKIEALLNTPYWIIDVLPARVPEDSPGQYFAVEEYWLREQRAAIRQKHANLVLKLNCYRDIAVEGEVNPAPDRTAEIMEQRYVCILIGDSMIVSDPDDTYLTLFNPDEELLGLVRALAAGEGLYVWKGSAE